MWEITYLAKDEELRYFSKEIEWVEDIENGYAKFRIIKYKEGQRELNNNYPYCLSIIGEAGEWAEVNFHRFPFIIRRTRDVYIDFVPEDSFLKFS